MVNVSPMVAASPPNVALIESSKLSSASHNYLVRTAGPRDYAVYAGTKRSFKFEESNLLTRLEVDGFKNLVNFSCNFGPYTCIAGPNSVGKSNIFDAIQFLSATTRETFDQAAASIRSSSQLADISDIFRKVEAGNPKMTISAEMIVPDQTTDDLNRTVVPTSTFLRYELALELKSFETGYDSDFHTIRLVSESLKYFKVSEANDKIPWLRGKKQFRESVIKNARKGTHYILTEDTQAGKKYLFLKTEKQSTASLDGGGLQPYIQRGTVHSAQRSLSMAALTFQQSALQNVKLRLGTCWP